MRKLFKKSMALVLTSAMAITGAVSFAPQSAKTVKAAEKAVYSAYTAFQVNGSWASRANWADSKAGLNGGKDYQVEVNDKKVTYNYLKHILVNNADAKEPVIDAGIKDADNKITDNGTYTMEMTNLPMTGFPGMKSEDNPRWNMLDICTDIPVSEKNVKCTNVKVYFDGETTPFATLANAPYNQQEETNNGVLDFFIFDTYSGNHKTSGVLDCEAAKYKRFPKKSMKIEFTISGIDFGKQKVEVPVANGPMVDQTFTAGDFKYKVTERSMSNGKKGKVVISGIAPAAAKKSSLSTVSVATNGTCKYDVTGINAKAFQNSKKLKKVKVGSTIKSIGSSAFKKCKKLTSVTYNKKVKSVAASTFEGCTSLSKITLGSKVKSIGKSAFKGCKKLSKVSVSQKVKVSKGAFKGCKKTIKVSGKKANKKYTVAQIKKSGYKKVK